MSVSLTIALYFIIWWVTLFAVLPFGLRTQADEGEVVPGTPESAPARVRILRIFAINTVVSSIVLFFVWLVISQRWITIDAVQIPGAS
jgi:predicted secreted protein